MPYREISPNTIYHVYNRGALSMTLFRDKSDYKRFLTKLNKYCFMYDIQIHVYCLMPNHFHLLLKEPEVGDSEKQSNISLMMHRLLLSYAKYFNCKYDYSGVVFQSRFQSKLVKFDAYYFKLKEYIVENPVRKGLVKKAKDWLYSNTGDRAIPGISV